MGYKFYVTSKNEGNVGSHGVLGGSSQLVVSNHGDRFRPQFLGWFSFQMAEIHWPFKWGPHALN